MSEEQTHIIIRRTPKVIQGQLYIGGNGGFKDATVKVQLADCTMQDAPAKVLSEVTIVVAERPSINWLTFRLPVAKPADGEYFDLKSMHLLAQITAKNGKLLYVTKVTHRVDVSRDVSPSIYATVVVEQVK